MQGLWELAAFRLYALAATIASVHAIALAIWTVIQRSRAKKFVNPEDAKTFKGAEVEAEVPTVLRAKRAHLNQVENLVPFLGIGFLYALTSPSATAANAYFWTFIGTRVVHSLTYIAGAQPWRTIMYVIGMLATLGMAYHVLRVALAS